MITSLFAAAQAVPLPRAIEDALADDALAGASIGLVVIDEEGEVRYAHDPDRRLVPASVAKWVTASAAARDLGLDYTFSTRIGVTGSADGNRLAGDLVIIGGGDPSFGDDNWEIAVDRVVQTALASGIGQIDGSIVVDTRHALGEPWGPGWMWDDLKLSYSPPYGAVNFAHNLLQRGMNCPAQDGRGSPLLDPAQCLADTVRAALLASGVKVSGPAVVGARPEAAEIGVIRSEPLWLLLHHMLVESDNLYAECVARALDRDLPAEDGPARARVDLMLAEAGVVEKDAKLVDGSGLSRYSLVSARSLAAVSAWDLGQPWGRSLVALLPVAGRSGTLASRLVGTPAEGRVQAKTGSMSGVRNLVGYVENDAGEKLVFAFLINGFVVSQSEAIAVQDRVLALIAASRGSGGIPAETAEALTATGG